MCVKALAAHCSCSKHGLAFWLQAFLGRTLLFEYRGSEAHLHHGHVASAVGALRLLNPGVQQTCVPSGRSSGCSQAACTCR